MNVPYSTRQVWGDRSFASSLGSSFRLLGVACVVATALNVCSTDCAVSQEFRIESEVLTGNSKEPTSENLTLFLDGMIYDFVFAPGDDRVIESVVVFRVPRTLDEFGEFVFLDPQRKLRFQVDSRTIADMVSKMKVNPVLNEKIPHLVNPEFEENWDEETEWLTLESKQISYRARGTRLADAKAADMYHYFADWYAKLKVLDPMVSPPFARLELNRVMHRRGIIPEVVELTLSNGGMMRRPTQVSSKHYLVWQLSKTDREYIDQAEGMIGTFASAKYELYFRLDALNSPRN